MSASHSVPLSQLGTRAVEAGYALGTAVAAQRAQREDEQETYAEYLERARREQED